MSWYISFLLADEYMNTYIPESLSKKPQAYQVIPIEEEIHFRSEALPHEQVSNIIENGKSFRILESHKRKVYRLRALRISLPIRGY